MVRMTNGGSEIRAAGTFSSVARSGEALGFSPMCLSAQGWL